MILFFAAKQPHILAKHVLSSQTKYVHKKVQNFVKRKMSIFKIFCISVSYQMEQIILLEKKNHCVIFPDNIFI